MLGAPIRIPRRRPAAHAAIAALLWATASTAKRATIGQAEIGQVGRRDANPGSLAQEAATAAAMDGLDDAIASNANASVEEDSCADFSLPAFTLPTQVQASCKACIATKESAFFGSKACKWCPLSQGCVSTGTGRGSACPKRSPDEKFTVDLKVNAKTDADRCNDEPLWLEWMNRQYGREWETTWTEHDQQAIEGAEKVLRSDSTTMHWTTEEKAKAACIRTMNCAGFTMDDTSCTVEDKCPTAFFGFGQSSMKLRPSHGMKSFLLGRAHHLDAKRCFQWALDWPIEQVKGLDPDPEGDDGPDQEAMGTWGCTSVLLRHATLGMLSALPKATGFTDEEGGTRMYEPPVCEILALKGKKGQKCETRTYLIKEFERLRAKALQQGGEDGIMKGITHEMIQSVLAGPLVSFKPGAGLSGSTFAQSWDGKFMLKLGLRTDTVHEPNNLIAMVQGKGGRTNLFDHFKNNPDSLLIRIYGLLKIDMLGEESRWGMWMQDASFHAADQAATAGFPSPPRCSLGQHCVTRYDLKGKSRPQFREQKPDRLFTLENGDWRKKEMYMHLADDDCRSLWRSTDADGEFLNKWKMIDYSFFFAVVDKPREARMHCLEDIATSPSCMQSPSAAKLYTVSIIDYLNNRVWTKKLESATHGGKFDNYAGKMSDYVRAICRTTANLTIFQPLKEAILGHYTSAADPTLTAFRKHSQHGSMDWYDFKRLLVDLSLYDATAEDHLAVKNSWKVVFKGADYHHKGSLDQWQFAWAFKPSPEAGR